MPISTQDVAQAKRELARLKGSLARWLKYRTINDAVMAGTAKTRKPLAYAQAVVGQARDVAAEQRLASQLAVLLTEIAPDAQLPSSDLSQNPQGAVQLAQIVISGNIPTAPGPASQGATHAWLWPVLIVGGLLLAVTTAIHSAADVAEQKEHDACIEAGACTDTGFFLKAAAIVGLGWFVWKGLGVGDVVRGHIKGR